ncbi:MAG: hypothetical protein ABSB59_21160 [Streptosporangiaceae bacterium]
MNGWIVLTAFLLSPLACWVLLARTKVLGWTFAAVFAAYAVAEGSQLQGAWPFRDEPLGMLFVLPVMTVVALILGTLLENRELGATAADTGRGVRGQVGVLLASFYGIAVIGTVIVIIVMVASVLSGSS